MVDNFLIFFAAAGNKKQIIIVIIKNFINFVCHNHTNMKHLGKSCETLIFSKHFVALVIFTIITSVVFAQSVTVRFSGLLDGTTYQRLDSVKVSDISRGWTETVYYPDTIAILSQTGYAETNTLYDENLYQNVPNPFDCTTTAELSVHKRTDVNIQLLDINGRPLSTYNGILNAGIHKLEITAQKPQTYILNAKVGAKSYSIRMVNIGNGTYNSIKYIGQSQDLIAKLECINQFMTGDNMGYIGYATINGNATASSAVIQQQFANQYITLNFSSQSSLPNVTTLAATDISHTSAIINGRGFGGETHGFLYGTSPENLQYNVTAPQSLIEDFSYQLTNLTPETTYYFMAYATNQAGTTTGETLSFTTTSELSSTIPEVVTNQATAISSTSATIGGTLLNGGQNTTVGFLYGTSEDNLQYFLTTSLTSNQNFSLELSSLTPNTTYYYAAYATNSAGTDIGETLSFTTEQEYLPTAPEVVTNQAISISTTSATIRGSLVSGEQNSTVGFRYSSSEANLQYNVTASMTSTQNFSYRLSGLTPNTTYYYAAYATNSAGSDTGEILSFTTASESDPSAPEVVTNLAATVTSTSAIIRGTLLNGDNNTTVGFLHGTLEADLQYNVTASLSNSQDFSYRLSGLTPNTTYYYAAYATNSIGTSTGETLCFTTVSETTPTFPEVITLNATDIGPTNATINGQLLNGEQAATLGFMYGTNTNNINLQHNVIATQTNSGYFSYQLTELSPNTTYYFKAYATNSVGTDNGEILSFSTTPSSSQYDREINFSGLANNIYNTYAYYYIELDSVRIENLTQNWSRMLYFPDTTLYINFPGRQIIDENISSTDNIKFIGYTTYRETSYTSDPQTITPSMNRNLRLLFHIPYCDDKTIIIRIQDCEPITYNGITYYNSGIYTEGQYLTSRGCDSTVMLDLRIRNYIFNELYVNTCEEEYEFGDTIITESGSYQQTFISHNGCDSIVSLNLTLEQGFRDERDGNVYCTITYGNQVWMKENLRYLPQVYPPSNTSANMARYYVYDYSGTNTTNAKATENYEKYGVLYNYDAAMISCPAGWHLPSDTEWTMLEIYLQNNGYNFDGYVDSDNNRDTHNVIAKSMAANNGWTTSEVSNAVGWLQEKNNASGFNGKPGGENYIQGFQNINQCAIWWTSTPNTGSNCWDRYLFFSRDFCNRTNNHRSIGMSVRCIQD